MFQPSRIGGDLIDFAGPSTAVGCDLCWEFTHRNDMFFGNRNDMFLPPNGWFIMENAINLVDLASQKRGSGRE